MAQNQNPGTNAGQSGQQKPKNGILLRAFADVVISQANTFTVFIEVNAFKGGQPMANQEVVLKERTNIVNQQILDANGEVMLRATGQLQAQEQIKSYRITLPGHAEEKSVNVTIPAIPVPVWKPKNMQVVASTLQVDNSTATYSGSLRVSVFDGANPVRNQRVACYLGLGQIGQEDTDNFGNATFNVTGQAAAYEKIDTYRFSLVGLPDNVICDVTVPAVTKPTVDNDPETLTLRRHHDGCGNFKVFIRVLNHNGQGLKTKVSLWYKGAKRLVSTDERGEAVWKVPGIVNPGESFRLTGSVSGIAQEATLDIKRRNLATPPAAFSKAWFRINNGRAFIITCVLALAWIITIFIGTGEPILNEKMFHNDSGLSSAQELWNKSAEIADQSRIYQPQDDWSTWPLPWWAWLVILTVIGFGYCVFALREEIAAGIEDGIEALFDKKYSKAGDPKYEQLGKIISSYTSARRGVTVPISPTGKTSEMGHPSLATLFKLDLLSDALVEIVPAVFKRIF